MKLLLIRHGDPDYANDTLTDKGHRQAELLAESLLQVPIDHLLVSPLGRASHTAEYIINLKKLDYKHHEFLKELNGCYNDIDYAWDYSGCDVLTPGNDITKSKWSEQVPYGKHMEPVFQEFTSSFDSCMSSFGLERFGHLYRVNELKDETIAIVCHMGVILTILSHVLHIPLPIVFSQFRIDPSSVTKLELEVDQGLGVFRLMSLNDMSHAKSLPDVVYVTAQS
ncbi:MAG: histidine phosphatase family protein [Spirochaetaceae bacterium]